MDISDCIRELHFCYNPKQRDRFVDGKLGEHWAERYPELFDEDDLRLYHSQCQDGYHFFEWLGAILIYEATGYLSLIEKYGCGAHPKKGPVFEALTPAVIQDMDGAGWPDLFCYAEDRSDWYFCETKGATDKLRPIQIQTFPKLCEITGKRISVLNLKKLRL